jgi:hypothetical protein
VNTSVQECLRKLPAVIEQLKILYEQLKNCEKCAVRRKWIAEKIKVLENQIKGEENAKGNS